MAADRQETTPLLANGDGLASTTDITGDGDNARKTARRSRWSFTLSGEARLLIASFVITAAFNLTQTPIIYALRLMVCQDFYDHRDPTQQDPGFPPPSGTDRCDRHEVNSALATQLSIVGMSMIFCSVANLFGTGKMIKLRGPRFALVFNIGVPVLRVAVQIAALRVGGRWGLVMFQASQALCFVGGPAGYMLAVNSAVAEVVPAEERTNAFGMLQGSSFLGTALGYFGGGVLGDHFDIARPFEVNGAVLALCVVVGAFYLPYIDPRTLGTADKASGGEAPNRHKGMIEVLSPRKLRLADGRLVTYHGVWQLAFAMGVSVMALSFMPPCLQLYAIDRFRFSASENSGMLSVNSLLRGVFLMFGFPRLVVLGRRWYARVGKSSGGGEGDAETVVVVEAPAPKVTAQQQNGGHIPTEPAEIEPIAVVPAEVDEPTPPVAAEKGGEGVGFDLLIMRLSVLFEAVVTGCVAFATQGWHIHLVAYLIPLASGTSPTAKGILTEMVPAADRVSALQAMTTVEYASVFVAIGGFGNIFSAFASIDKAYLTFVLNAVIAMIAVGVLAFTRLPPPGSSYEEDVNEHGTVDEAADNGDTTS